MTREWLGKDWLWRSSNRDELLRSHRGCGQQEGASMGMFLLFAKLDWKKTRYEEYRWRLFTVEAVCVHTFQLNLPPICTTIIFLSLLRGAAEVILRGSGDIFYLSVESLISLDWLVVVGWVRTFASRRCYSTRIVLESMVMAWVALRNGRPSALAVIVVEQNPSEF